MLDLSQIATETEQETENFGRFVIDPLDQGYGHTIGNSLRRVLLSSLSGAAVTQVKISSVRHQFTALSGMSEDVVEFILNLKKLRLRITGDKSVKLSLDVKGPKEVKAKDIEKSAGVEIVNPDLTLAHLADSKSKLTATIFAENGSGYSLSDERKTGEIGLIPVDANFSPVTKVNYEVEATRVGRVTNFDKLTLEITTDGSIKPSEALKSAAQILVDHFKLIHEPQKVDKKQKATSQVEPSAVTEELLKTSLEELDLPVRLTNSLKSGRIETIGDFLGKDKRDLMKIKNMGQKSVSLVEEKLRERGVDVK